MTESLVKKDVIIFLSGIHTTEGVIRKVRNENLLKLMPRGPKLDKILTTTSEANFRHICYMTSDQLWINDGKRKLSLINKTGDDEYHLSANGVGFHTVNNKGELFYIDSSNNINKLLKEPYLYRQQTAHGNLCVFTGAYLQENYWSECAQSLRIHSRLTDIVKMDN